MNDALDFVFATNHRIQFAFAGDLRHITTEGAECRRLVAFFAAAFSWRSFAFLIHLILAHCEVGIEFLQNFLTRLLDVDVQILEHACRHAFAFAQEAEQNVLRAHVSVL